jgi:pyruvate/2-oxoglutarate dehydrogenase complex dihydrolipoamide dehydrogenase (E3) component
MFAVGRYAITKGLSLENAGVVCEKNGKFKKKFQFKLI